MELPVRGLHNKKDEFTTGMAAGRTLRGMAHRWRRRSKRASSARSLHQEQHRWADVYNAHDRDVRGTFFRTQITWLPNFGTTFVTNAQQLEGLQALEFRAAGLSGG
jgi:hypothetical protein